jgi:exosortase
MLNEPIEVVIKRTMDHTTPYTELRGVNGTNIKRLMLPAGLLVLLMGLLYAPVAPLLVWQWWDNPNYSHGFIVPLFAAYLVWTQREALRGLSARPHNGGLLLIVFGLASLYVGILGAELFTTRASFILVLAGLVLYLGGIEYIKVLAFPLGYLFFMIPLPAIVFNAIAFPLQLLASKLATGVMQGIGLPVLREGNLLYLPNITMDVVEACSGIRSLMSLLALAVAFAYFSTGGRLKRVILVASAIPIALGTNALRVAGMGALAHWVSVEAAEGFFHYFSGWTIFLLAMVLLAGEYFLLNRLFQYKTVNGSLQ